MGKSSGVDTGPLEQQAAQSNAMAQQQQALAQGAFNTGWSLYQQYPQPILNEFMRILGFGTWQPNVARGYENMAPGSTGSWTGGALPYSGGSATPASSFGASTPWNAATAQAPWSGASATNQTGGSWFMSPSGQAMYLTPDQVNSMSGPMGATAAANAPGGGVISPGYGVLTPIAGPPGSTPGGGGTPGGGTSGPGGTPGTASTAPGGYISPMESQLFALPDWMSRQQLAQQQRNIRGMENLGPVGRSLQMANAGVQANQALAQNAYGTVNSMIQAALGQASMLNPSAAQATFQSGANASANLAAGLQGTIAGLQQQAAQQQNFGLSSIFQTIGTIGGLALGGGFGGLAGLFGGSGATQAPLLPGNMY